MAVSVQEVFQGKRIFITGGSGFIGKVLIEKLLRSCDGIEVIYVLLRGKKNLSIEERLKKITDNELFCQLKKKNTDALKKLVPILGDVKERRLGMSGKDRRIIIENVNIIYHAAASVRFDGSLKDSILLNTRGTKEIVDLALEVKNLVSFMHISTTYCNTDKKIIEEKIYPPHADWRSSIAIAEALDQQTLDIMAPKYIYPLPNTYTFTKSLSEHVVNDECVGKIPTTVFRPSVVVSTYQDPIAGWIDNFKGPIGLLTAGGKGLVKIYYGDLQSRQDYIPVDIIVKMIILATKDRTLNKNLDEVTVYNGCTGDNLILRNKDVRELGKRLTWDAPYGKLFWYPHGIMTNNWYIYYTMYLLYHMLPALIVDAFLKLCGHKTILTKVQCKIYVANMALIYFMQNSWRFISNKAMDLTYNLHESDKEKFSFSIVFPMDEQEFYTFYFRAKIGAMKALFKEEFNRDLGYRNTMIMWILDHILHFTLFSVACWYIYVKLFDKLKEKSPDALKKLVPTLGDTKELRLGNRGNFSESSIVTLKLSQSKGRTLSVCYTPGIRTMTISIKRNKYQFVHVKTVARKAADHCVARK